MLENHDDLAGTVIPANISAGVWHHPSDEPAARDLQKISSDRRSLLRDSRTPRVIS